jgi:hypothetical protein
MPPCASFVAFVNHMFDRLTPLNKVLANLQGADELPQSRWRRAVVTASQVLGEASKRAVPIPSATRDPWQVDLQADLTALVLFLTSALLLAGAVVGAVHIYNIRSHQHMRAVAAYRTDDTQRLCASCGRMGCAVNQCTSLSI